MPIRHFTERIVHFLQVHSTQYNAIVTSSTNIDKTVISKTTLLCGNQHPGRWIC